MLLRFSISARIAAFRPFERSHQKFIYKNLTTYAFYSFKYELFSKFRGL